MDAVVALTSLRTTAPWHHTPPPPQAIAFVTFDSHPAGGVFIPTMHTAVELPGSASAKERESCEARICVLLPLPESEEVPTARL